MLGRSDGLAWLGLVWESTDSHCRRMLILFGRMVFGM